MGYINGCDAVEPQIWTLLFGCLEFRANRNIKTRHGSVYLKTDNRGLIGQVQFSFQLYHWLIAVLHGMFNSSTVHPLTLLVMKGQIIAYTVELLGSVMIISFKAPSLTICVIIKEEVWTETALWRLARNHFTYIGLLEAHVSSWVNGSWSWSWGFSHHIWNHQWLQDIRMGEMKTAFYLKNVPLFVEWWFGLKPQTLTLGVTLLGLHPEGCVYKIEEV